MAQEIQVGGRNLFCKLTSRAVRIRWFEKTLVHEGVSVASSPPYRFSCLMHDASCPKSCKYLGGLIDPEE